VVALRVDDEREEFMSANTISNLIIDLVPVLAFLAVFFFQWFAQRLPDKQREALAHFASIAVQRTEQLFSSSDNATKKQVAIQLVDDLFRAFKLPLPNATAVDAAIEAAVWSLSSTRSQQTAQPISASPQQAAQPVTPPPAASVVEQPFADGSPGA
jgi:LL-H family phage holin